jgi:hypothetical protein
MKKKIALASFALTAFTVSATAHTQLAQAFPIPNPNTTTSVVCYFQKGNHRLWKWGLKPNNGWFVLNGSWQKTRDTRITYFATPTSADTIRQSCRQSRAYYGYGNYTINGIYAANSSLGSNYPIYTGAGELRP